MNHLQTAMSPNPTDAPSSWGHVLHDLRPVVSGPFSPESERLLLDILAFSGQLNLDETVMMPHRLSPESMLKAMAIQALVKWTGAKHADAIRYAAYRAGNTASLLSTFRAALSANGIAL